MSLHASSNIPDPRAEVALRAAEIALLQRRRGSRDSTRDLYYEAHSLLRALRSHLMRAVEADEPAPRRGSGRVTASVQA
jgi:hypothetical protein